MQVKKGTLILGDKTIGDYEMIDSLAQGMERVLMDRCHHYDDSLVLKEVGVVSVPVESKLKSDKE